MSVWLIVGVVVFSFWANLPKVSGAPLFVRENVKTITGLFPLRLGLDLQGGTECVLQAKMEGIPSDSRDSALESAQQVIEKRVNLYGVSEAVVQTSRVGENRRILVELPGATAIQDPCSSIGQTALLDFREELATASATSAEASQSAQFTLENTKATGLTGQDLKKAAVAFGSTGTNTGPQVQLEFTTEGSQKFADITKRNVSKHLAIFLDNQFIEAPVVSQEILGGSAVINGQFTAQTAKDLSIKLNAGALPIALETLSTNTIPATLGTESVHKSILAAVIGVLTVMIFMVVYYGWYGLIADLALLLYILISMAVMRTGLFLIPPVTLSLAGIAGFILSIGMAVDANILIFERMKEEQRSGKSGKTVLNLGFSRAWSSIRDSNISSLITAAILITFGTSVVRGFAITLALGVLVSMFSAIMITKTLLKLLPKFN